MYCKELQKHFTDYIRRELPEELRARITEHLHLCTECRHEVESLENLWFELALAGVAEPETVSMQTRFNSMLNSSQPSAGKSSRSQGRRFPVLRAVLVMALLAVAVFAAQQNGVLTVVISQFVPRQPEAAVTVQSGIVTGQLLLPDGEPAINTRVAVMVVPEPPLNSPIQESALVSLSQTDKEGRYRLENIPPGRYSVIAGPLDSPTFYPGTTAGNNAKTLAVTSGIVTNGIDFTIARTITVRVYGHVIQALKPAAGTVQTALLFDSNSRLSSIIASDGSFEFSGVKPGEYRISVTPSTGLQPQPFSVGDKDLNMNVVVPLTVSVSGVASLDGGGVLPRFATEFTGMTGTPAYHASVNNTDGGKFNLVLPSGEYRLTITGLPAGYSVKTMKFGSTDLLQDTLKFGDADSPQILVTLGVSSPPPWVKVHGRLVGLPDTGLRASEIRLANPRLVVPAPQSALSADGSFDFPMLLPGSYIVNLVPASLEVQAIPPISVEVPASRGDITALEISLPSMQKVTGRIIWEGNGPQPGIGFLIGSAQRVQIARPDSGGRFTILVPEGEQPIKLNMIPAGYNLKAFTFGDTDLTINSLNPSKSGSAELQVVLSPASNSAWVPVSGKVIGGPTDLIGLITTRVTIDTPDNSSVSLARDGTFKFPYVPPGTYTIRTSATGSGVNGMTSVVVGNKEVTGIEIRLPRQIAVEGHATLEGNGLMPRVEVRLTGAAGVSAVRAQPEHDGSFIVILPEGEYTASIAPQSLPAGYTVTAFSYGSVDLTRQVIKVSAADPQDLNVRFKNAGSVNLVTVSGRVVNGAPGSTIVLNGSQPAPQLETLILSDSSFEFQKVMPGRYSLRTVQIPGPGSDKIGLSSAVGLSKDLVVGATEIAGIEFVVPRDKDVTIRTVVDGGGPPPRRFIIQLSGSLSQAQASARVEVNSNNPTIGVPVPIGDWQVSFANLPAGYFVKNAIYGAANLLKDRLIISGSDTAVIQLTLAVDSPVLHKISGKIIGPRGDASVLYIDGIVSVSIPIAADGSFESPGLPAGNYTAGFRMFGRTSVDSNFGLISVPLVIGNKDISGAEITIPLPQR